MGIFYELVEIVNRAPVNLTVRYDGQEMTLKPGSNRLPRQAWQYAMNQNPIMGSQSPEDPSIYGARFLVGLAEDPVTYPCDMLTVEEWEDHLKRPMRLDELALFEERYGGDPKARMVLHGGRGRAASAARSRSDAGRGETQMGDKSTFEHEQVG